MQHIARKLPNRGDIYNEFVLWSAMPHAERVKLGIEWQYQFEEYYQIDGSTLTRWKSRPDFEGRVDKIIHVWSIDKTPEVVQGMYRAAVKGNPMSQLLWLQYFKKFNAKGNDEKGGGGDGRKVEVSPNDIRNLIDILPEPLKSEHYANLRKLLDDSSAIRDARVVEDANWTTRPTESLQLEADNTPQDIPREEADELPKSNKKCVRASVVGSPFENYYQSPSRRWKE